MWLSFAASREQKLLDGMELSTRYIAVDRQSYGVNWTQRKDRRNEMLHAVGSADLDSGYVFGMNLNFEPTADPLKTEALAAAVDDYSVPHSFRRYARL
ncbi:MAG: hypothetical protein ABI155_16605 [Paralcaligenes sp.]